jgi:hypothetical protein
LTAGASITTPSLGLWAVNHNDPRYQELQPWDKDFFWHIMPDDWKNITEQEAHASPPSMVRQVGGQWQRNEGTIYRIPKPFELGLLFGSLPERLLDKFVADNPHAFQGFQGSLSSGLLPSWAPAGLLPPIEQWANKSFFTGSNLIPKSQEGKLPEEQYTPQSTETAKAVSRGLSGLNRAAGNPIPPHTFAAPVLENYVRQYTGGLGMYGLQGADIAGRQLGLLPKGVEKPTPGLADYPGIKGFVTRFPAANAQSIQNFYDTYTDRSEADKTMKALAKSGDLEGARRIQATLPTEAAQRIYTSLNAQYKTLRAIQTDQKMTGDEKQKRMEDVYFGMIALAQKGNELFQKTAQPKAQIPQPTVNPFDQFDQPQRQAVGAP